MKNCLVEFIGTFFLILVIGLTVISPGAGPMAPLAIGMVLMVMVYSGGHISGAHYNPAVTVAVTLRGKCAVPQAVLYIISQILAAIVAATLVGFIKVGATVSPLEIQIFPALLVEFLFTFALAFVVLNTATSKKNAGNSYYGLAIGFTVTAAAYAGGAISGGAFNPAVAIGVSLMGLSLWSNIWVFFLANFLAGILAAMVYKLINPEEF